MNSLIARIAVSLAAIFCALAAFKGGRICFSLRRIIPGACFAIGSDSAGGLKMTLLSYGAIAAFLCLLGLVAFWCQRPLFLASASLALLLLSLGAFFQAGFAN